MLFSKLRRGPAFTFGRIGALIMLALLAAVSFYSPSSASLDKNKASSGRVTAEPAEPLGAIIAPGRLGTFSPLFMPQAPPPPESLATYDAATCTPNTTPTPKTTFNLGETVCVKTTGVPVQSPALRAITWSNPASNEVQRTDLVSSPNDTFMLPTSQTSVVNGMVVDNRGTWTVKVVLAGRSKVRASVTFTVKDPAHPAVDLSVYNAVNNPSGDLPAGSNITIQTFVTNFGPDAAANVELTEEVPANATFVSESQDPNGPQFTCTNPASGGLGTSNCTIASLAKDARVEFTFVYLINSSAAKGDEVASQAQVSSTTSEINPKDNSWTARATVTGAATTPTCTLTCPLDITVNANTVQNQVSGAIVTFAAETSGTCGTVTASPASGSFFPVGATTVTVTSSDGGGSCSFQVKVLDALPPTIECPSNIAVTTAENVCEAEVALGTPTTTGTGVTVEGVRSDGQKLNAPYPGGTTTIKWIATDLDGRTAACQQTVTVTVNDTIAPKLTAPPDVNMATPPGTSGSCGLVIGETELGTPDASDNCTVNVTRTGVPAGNFFPVGTTTITYTATDGAGNSAPPVTQTVTVTDGTPPVIFAPADASYTCRSEVPAGNPSQANGGFDASGQLLPVSDNCGTPTVTVSDSSTGAGSASSPLVITRTFTATDGANNTASAVQIIKVIDDTPPTITAPPDVNANTGVGASSCDTTLVTLGTAQAGDNCASVSVSRSPSGNTFAVGTTDVIWTATDAAGNTATATQHVTVADNTAPTITPPADQQVNADSGSCSATGVALGTPTTADNCAVASVTNNAPSSFPLGNTTVTWTVTDAAGNTATAAQKVTVVDNQNPTITAPAAQTVNADAGSCGATGVALGTPTTADNCSVASVTNNAPTVFPVGTTTVIWTVTDGSTNTATATQNVTVVDNQNPTITAPADKTLYTGAGATSCDVTVGNLDATLGTATANDNCAGVTWTRGGGNVFPLGDTTVTYTATDAHGHTATATQKVTVVDNTPPVVTLTGANPMTVECHTGFTNPGATANDNCAGNLTGAIAVTGSVNPNVPGTYHLDYSVSDGHGNTTTVTRTVNVVDTIPPSMTFNNLTIFLNSWTIVFNTNTFTVNGTTYPFNGVSCTHEGYTFAFNGHTVTVTKNGYSVSYTFSGNTLVLWTPTHQYQTVKVADLIASATDGCDGNVDRNNVVISQATSDEPEDIAGGGDGNTLNDIVIAPGCKSVQLRAERNGNGDGRVYTITMRVRDAAGNSTTVTSKLKVFANSFNVVDSGPQYTVNGTCP